MFDASDCRLVEALQACREIWNNFCRPWCLEFLRFDFRRLRLRRRVACRSGEWSLEGKGFVGRSSSTLRHFGTATLQNSAELGSPRNNTQQLLDSRISLQRGARLLPPPPLLPVEPDHSADPQLLLPRDEPPSTQHRVQATRTRLRKRPVNPTP
jgi:hypothetical protein